MSKEIFFDKSLTYKGMMENNMVQPSKQHK